VNAQASERSARAIHITALVFVGVTAVYVMVMAYRLSEMLSGPNWCARALGAEKASPGMTIKGLEACIDLLKIQLKAGATNSHILFGTIALCLGVLIVVVIAGARMAFKATKEGLEGNVSRDGPAAAEHVAEAADNAADEVRKGAAP
jgi:hypothetical protein